MDSYDVILSEPAKIQLNSYINYIQYTLFNNQAADAVLVDVLETIHALKSTAGSLRFCDDPDLKSRGYRKISLSSHDYVMLYKLEGRTACIDGIYHQMQDYENLFRNSIQ